MSDATTPEAPRRTKSDRIYFEHMDVIRFLAAFMIVILHAYEAWCGWYGELGILSNDTYTTLSDGGVFVDRFIRNMGIGVDVFFLLSGFLITYILLEERKKFGKIAIGKFMMRRTLRIWPLYYFLIAISPFLVDWVASPNPPHYLANALFVGNFETIISETWSFPFAHFWSICVEEHFYLVWPFIIAFIPTKRMLPTFVGLILLSVLFRVHAASTMDTPWHTIYLHSLSRMDVLIIGAIGAFFYSKKRFEFHLPKYLRITLLLVLIFAFCLESRVMWNSIFLAGFKKFFYTGIIAVLLLDYNLNPNFKHLLPRGSFIHYLGKVSYGIYMYSNMLLLIIIKKIMWPLEIKNAWVFFGICIVLSLLIPIISYELFEKHILKLNKRFRVIETKR